jgi:ABC-type sugar transport system ATPase subunit
MEVTLENLTKKYGKTTAIEALNLKVNDGELVTLLGPSGCGKSTTLYCIAGLERPDRGKVFIGERDVTSLPPKDRNVAMVFQSIALFPHLSIKNNIAFGLRMQRKFSEEEMGEKVKNAGRLLRIEHLLERMPHELSGGQQQRAAIGRAIVRNPSVFLMDEPFANLDARLKIELQTELRRLNQRLGATIIHVTHDQNESMSISDRIVIINEGKIQQMGSPMEVYFRPKNIFIARFIGNPPMNIFSDCEFKFKEEKGLILLNKNSEIALSPRLAHVIKESNMDKVGIGIRPEDFCIVSANQRSPRGYIGSLKVSVEVIEKFGREIVVHFGKDRIRLGGVFPPVEVQELQVGDEVYLAFREKNIYLFDPTTGKSLSS